MINIDYMNALINLLPKMSETDVRRVYMLAERLYLSDEGGKSND